MDRIAPDRRVPEAFSRYGSLLDDRRAFEAALVRPLPTCVWANPLRASAGELESVLHEDGLEPVAIGWLDGAFRVRSPDGGGAPWWYLAGLAHVQEEASLLPVACLDVRPGLRVLDLCAAPGGKTARIGVALGGRGTVVANDVARVRMRSLRDTVDRLGLTNVTVTLGDGGSVPRGFGGFDRVLVDAPCSGEGTIRKLPPGAGRFGPDLSRDYSRRQIAILRKAVQLCRPGGRVVYSTCTFAPEENEAVVDAVLRQEQGRGLRLIDVAVPGLATRPGVTAWEGERYDSQLERCLRLWPHHNDTGGFFVAAIVKDGPDDDRPTAPFPFVDVEPDAWRPHVVDRFGIDPDVLGRYRIHRRTKRGPHLVSADHEPPGVGNVEAVGIRFMKTRTMHPKLTTPGATVLGPSATRNRIELRREQRAPYLARRAFDLDADQRAAIDGTGFALVAFRGHVLGLGIARAGSSTFESAFPKRWATPG